jgi:uncharacterized protein
MKCPICPETDLVMTERQGVEIDYCPKCRGVWLDRGELDKIIERSMSVPTELPVRRETTHHEHEDARRHSKHHGDHRQGHYGRRRSWLGDLFD